MHEVAGERPRHSDDVSRQGDREAVCGDRGWGREQIQPGLFRCLGGILVAVTTLAAEGDQIPFSHKKHAVLRLACITCHVTAKRAERAGFPAVSNCMVCHKAVLPSKPAIQRLAGLPSDAKLFASRVKLKLPDFVFFSHARHTTAGIRCESCHGAILEQDSTPTEAPVTMNACVGCHQLKKATVACNACHELSQ